MGTARDRFEHDELEAAHDAAPPTPRNGSARPPLPEDATPEEMVKAINILAKAVGDQARELQLIREAYQEHGKAIGAILERVEKALDAREQRT